MRRILPFAALCVLLLLCSCGEPAPLADAPDKTRSEVGDVAERKPLLAHTRLNHEAPDVPGGEGCTGEGGGYNVAVLSPDGRGSLLTDDHISGTARISPDGRRVAFASGRDGRMGPTCGTPGASVYVMDADGSEQRRLTRLGGDSRPLEWSPDGEHVAFSHVRGGRYEVWVADADKGEAGAERLIPAPVEVLAFAPDGQRIAYVRAAPPGLSEDAIWTADADGRNPRRLLTDRRLASVSDLEFSPDGETLAVSAVEPDAVVRPRPGSKKFRIHGDGGNVLALVPLDEPRVKVLAKSWLFSGVSWTSDGGHLVYLGQGDRPPTRAVTEEGLEVPLPEAASTFWTTELDWGPYPLDTEGGGRHPSGPAKSR